MLTLLKTWKGRLNVNGVDYNSISDVNINDFNGDLTNIHIKLYPATQTVKNENGSALQTGLCADNTGEHTYKIKVKKYMTQKSSPQFDFMEKWNKDVPMPLRVMYGEVVKETRGMVYMKLHADIVGEKICTCMKCGKPITNPVSQYFGMGPECGNHNYTNPFSTDEELKKAVNTYREELKKITWEGWIIKSAIEEKEEI